MIRVCQLYSPVAGYEAVRTAEQLCDNLGDGFDVMVRRSTSRSPWAALLTTLQHRRAAGFDIVHAWDAPSLAQAVTMSPRVVFTPPATGLKSAIRLARAVMAHADVQVVCPTATMHRLAVERGIPLERCHLIRPGVEFARVNQRRDRSLRAALGFEEQDVVLAAVGESTPQANHRLVVWVMSILRVLEPCYKALLWGRGPQAEQIAHFARVMEDERVVCLAERRLGQPIAYEAMLAAADIVLNTADGVVDTLPIATAMAAGLPIVSVATPTASELLEDRHTALMVPKAHPRLLSQRVLDLRTDVGLQWQISDRARTEAFSYFAPSRMIDQYRSLYEQMAAGKAVVVEQSDPGAGARFHARV